MLTVHHLNNSRSHRVLWLLEELGVDYALETYQRDPDTMLAPASLQKVHPLGKSPVITDGGRTVAESGAILEYIVDEYGDGRLRPAADTEAYLRYRYWMHYAEGSAMSPLFLKLVFNRLPAEAPLLARPLVSLISKTVQRNFVDRRLKTHLDYWEQQLSEADYFVGDDFTAADIQMSYPLEAGVAGDPDRAQHPNIIAAAERFRTRPAYQLAVERGGGLSMDVF